MKKVFFLVLTLPLILFNCNDKEDEPEAKPSGMSITAVTINKFPSVDANNDDWDGSLSGTHPDVYFLIYDGNDNVIYSLPVSERKENLRNSDLPSTFTKSNPYYTFSNLSQGFSIVLYDYDSLDDDDFIGGVQVGKTLAEYGNDAPNFIDLVYGDYNFRVNVDWIY